MHRNLFLVADSYFERNGPWLHPLLAALILTLVPMILAKMPDAELPEWLGFASLAGVFVGLLLCGVFAALTDTLFAKIMRFAAWGALTVVAVNWLVKFLAGGALG